MAWCKHCKQDRPIQRHTFEDRCPTCHAKPNQQHVPGCRGPSPGVLDVCTYCNNSLFALAMDEATCKKLHHGEWTPCKKCNQWTTLKHSAEANGFCPKCLGRHNLTCCGCILVPVLGFVVLFIYGLVTGAK